MRFSTAAVALAGLATVDALATISTKGTKFFTSDGNQFFVKGIAYQLVPQDPLVDNTQCSLDAKLMQTIGTNSIRVYHVDPSSSHDDCMKTFADAGIYIWLDLDTFDTQINPDTPIWNQSQVDRFEKVMDAFHSYDNLAGFFVGNEVLTMPGNGPAAPYVKAAARDMKAYRDRKNYRKIPIGYSAADISSLRPMQQNYLACGTNASEALDFYSLNAYSWCGDSNFQQSGYSDLVKRVTDAGYNIPIFLSETGCIEPPNRDFKDQEAIFGDQMNDVYSGAIIYEWIQEANNYGIISYGPKVDPASPSAPPDGYPRSGTPTPRSPDFSNLSERWKTLNPTGVKMSAYSPSLTAVACPAYTSGAWEVNPTSALPTIGQTFRAQATNTASSGTANGSASETGSASPSQTAKGGAAGWGDQKELRTMGLGLVGVLAGMLVWM